MWILHFIALHMLSTVSSRSTRRLEQVPENKPNISLWHSVFSLEDRVLLYYCTSFQHDSESSVDTKGSLCVCMCVRVCACVCLLKGYRQELRSLQLSQWDVNIYDMLFAICYVWTLSPPDICFQNQHVLITQSEIMRRNQRDSEFKMNLTIILISPQPI